MENYPKIAEQRKRGNPQPRMTRDGYTKRGGSPVSTEIRLEGETRFRRVYVICFSNIGTCIIKVKGKAVIVNP